jgi:predicted DNA binding CopG/RHH family protein
MEELLTSEDILLFLIAIGLLYAVLNFVQKKVQQLFDKQKELFQWGLNQKLTDNQQNYLLKLWFAYKNKSIPDQKINEKISEKEFEEIKRLSSRDSLPDNLKFFSSARKRSKTVKKLILNGFTEDQAEILCGLIYNKIGGIHAIRSIPSHIISN